jgi:hypothetical protein
LSSIKVPLKQALVLRVQIEGKKHYIKELMLEEPTALEIEIPEMPGNAYGYMNTASACAAGEIQFEIFGEKRHSVIPMLQTFGIALPLSLDEKNKMSAQKFTLLFKKKGETQEKKIEITVSREDQTIDLCEFL